MVPSFVRPGERIYVFELFQCLLAFMGVNASAFVRYHLREPKKTWSGFLTPLAGFTVCLLLWLNLSWPAKVAGSIWMALGITYGAVRTRGFKAELVTFDVPEDTEVAETARTS